ncbi:MAG: SurA N-terminal domain-containing protein [Gammaproteobacteria bacterium]
MLMAIRERIMGFLGWVILGLIFIAFAFWGLDSYLQSSATTYAARVNDAEISLRQHDQAYQALVQRIRESVGKDYEKAGYDEDTLRQQSLKRLITDELFFQAAESAGFSVGGAIIASQINSIEAFRADGRFSKDQYQRVLSYQGMTPGLFEWTLKRELMVEQLKNGIALTAVTTDENFSRLYRLDGQQRRFDHLRLPAKLVSDQVTISDADLEAYFEQHGDEFMTREQARVQYVELDAADIELESTVDEAEIEALYTEQAARFVVPEERRARHILISTADGAEAAVNAGRGKAQQVVDRLDAGEDFAALAAELSDDPVSATAGGDLGFFGPGIMTPEFEQTVFTMNVGERSKPVQTAFGFHVIELLEVRPEQRTPLAEVRDELIRELQSEERADLFYDKSDMMANLAFEQPDTLEGVAEALQLQIKESDWIGRDGGPGIGENDDIVEAVFGVDVLQNDGNSTTIEIGENHIVVLRKMEYQQARPRPFDEVREQIRSAVRTRKIRELLETQGKQYLAELEQGSTTLEAIAGKHALTSEQHPLMKRNATEPDRAIVRQAFSMRPPLDDKPVYSGLLLPQGDYALVALHEVRDGTITGLDEEQLTQAKRGLSRILGASDVQLVLDGLENTASIEIPEQADF